MAQRKEEKMYIEIKGGGGRKEKGNEEKVEQERLKKDEKR